MTQNSQGILGADVSTDLADSGVEAPLVENRRTASGATAQSDIHARTDVDNSEAVRNFVESTHTYVRECIWQADQKAGFFFAISTALLAYLYAEDLLSLWLSLPSNWSLNDFFSLVAAVGLSSSSFLALLVVMPRLGGSGRGIIFFDAIRQSETSGDYVEQVIKTTPERLVEERLRHVYELSGICSRKYRLLVNSLYAGTAGVVAAILLLVFNSS